MPEIQTRAPSQNLLRQPPQTFQVQDMGFWLSPAAGVLRHCTVTHLETVKSLQLLELPCPAACIAGVFLIPGPFGCAKFPPFCEKAIISAVFSTSPIKKNMHHWEKPASSKSAFSAKKHLFLKEHNGSTPRRNQVWCNLRQPCAMDPNRRCTGGPMTPRCAGLCAHSVARLSQILLRTLLCKGQAHSLVLD